MTPLGFLVTLIFALLVLCQSRRTAAVGIIAAVCYITEGQVLDSGVFHFTAIRIVLLAGLVRVIARGETTQFRLNRVDVWVFAYASAIGIITTLRVGTTEEMIYQLGCFYNVFLSYFVFRCLVRGERDCRDVLADLAYVIVPFMFFLIYESLTTRNVFAGFGGVPEFSEVRYGHVRSQGAFRTPNTAGPFGATFAVLFASLWFAGTRNRRTVIGLVASTVIVICAHSSGAFLGMLVGFAALGCWFVRRHVSKIRWGILAVLVVLQLIMKDPVWFILDRVAGVVGGGGYHRALLIDRFVNDFSAWWLMGTSQTQNWFPYKLAINGKADITNMFVAAGVDAGLPGLIIFIALLGCCFRQVGAALKSSGKDKPVNQKFIWGIGSTLVCSIAMLISTTYFDQMQVVWYFFLACIAGLEIRTRQIDLFSKRGRSESFACTAHS